MTLGWGHGLISDVTDGTPLYTARLANSVSARAVIAIERNDLIISQTVRLELQYLHEIGRITAPAEDIVQELEKRIGLNLSPAIPGPAVTLALNQQWTRDVFDRLIVTEAAIQKRSLISKDRNIRKNYPLAIW